jgi:predicted enzyme related to lactoylglutathione lyase
MAITGMHALVYTTAADKTRDFLRNILGFESVDAGHGWLIFAAPPTEMAVHPVETAAEGKSELYMMCDDIHATIAEMKAKGAEITQPVADRRWGLVTAIRLPDGGEMGLYQPLHPTAIGKRS